MLHPFPGSLHVRSRACWASLLSVVLPAPSCAPSPCCCCRYGGGDDIRFSRAVLSVQLPVANIPADLRAEIVAAARTALAAFPPSAGGDSIVRLSAVDFGDALGSALSWEFKFTILTYVCARVCVRCVCVRVWKVLECMP